MLSARQQFRDNLARARELGHLGGVLGQLTNGTVDVSDIWRAQIVLSVSALDHLIHEITRLGMLDCAKGVRAKTDAFLRFAVPMGAVDLAIAGQPHELWLGEAVREKHGWLSFQHPDKISEAIRLISSIGLWDAVATRLGTTAKDAKLRMQLIIERRNRIAHEADLDPTTPGYRWPITSRDSGDSLSFIESIGEAIVAII